MACDGNIIAWLLLIAAQVFYLSIVMFIILMMFLSLINISPI